MNKGMYSSYVQLRLRGCTRSFIKSELPGAFTQANIRSGRVSFTGSSSLCYYAHPSSTNCHFSQRLQQPVGNNTNQSVTPPGICFRKTETEAQTGIPLQFHSAPRAGWIYSPVTSEHLQVCPTLYYQVKDKL